MYDFGEKKYEVNKERQIIKFSGNKICETERFKYLRSVLQNDGGLEENMKHRVTCEWMK